MGSVFSKAFLVSSNRNSINQLRSREDFFLGGGSLMKDSWEKGRQGWCVALCERPQGCPVRTPGPPKDSAHFLPLCLLTSWSHYSLLDCSFFHMVGNTASGLSGFIFLAFTKKRLFFPWLKNFGKGSDFPSLYTHPLLRPGGWELG